MFLNFSVYKEHSYFLAYLSEHFLHVLDYTFKPVSNENVEVIKRNGKILVFGAHASDCKKKKKKREATQKTLKR